MGGGHVQCVFNIVEFMLAIYMKSFSDLCQGMRVGRGVRPVRPQALDPQPHPLDLVTHACVYRGFVSFFSRLF